MEYYGTGLDLPFNFELTNWKYGLNSQQLSSLIQPWLIDMPPHAWPNWVLGNHDQHRFVRNKNTRELQTKLIHRFASRLGGPIYTDVGNILLLTLPGTPTCYYGDEIGMTDIFVSYNETVDPFGRKWGPDGYMNYTRDPERSPMQWCVTISQCIILCIGHLAIKRVSQMDQERGCHWQRIIQL
jgi:glycosidase